MIFESRVGELRGMRYGLPPHFREPTSHDEQFEMGTLPIEAQDSAVPIRSTTAWRKFSFWKSPLVR
jgi:hypothetical protein